MWLCLVRTKETSESLRLAGNQTMLQTHKTAQAEGD